MEGMKRVMDLYRKDHPQLLNDIQRITNDHASQWQMKLDEMAKEEGWLEKGVYQYDVKACFLKFYYESELKRSLGALYLQYQEIDVYDILHGPRGIFEYLIETSINEEMHGLFTFLFERSNCDVIFRQFK